MRISDWSSDVCSSDLQRSRDKRALAALDTYLGDAVGRAYAEKYFPASAKAEVSDMVGGSKAAFDKRVNTIDWMAPDRSAERRVGKECVSTCRSRWSPYYYKHKIFISNNKHTHI